MLFNTFIFALLASATATLPSAPAEIGGELGLEKLGFFIVKLGWLVGFVKHKPIVDLDGPAFLLVTFGNGTKVEPKILDLNCPFVNPAGLPLKAGVDNVVFFKFDIYGPLADPSLLKYYKSLAVGDKLEIHIRAYKLLTTSDGASIQLLDTIHVVVIKPDYKLHGGMDGMPMIGYEGDNEIYDPTPSDPEDNDHTK
eukprot:gene15439-32650_t